MDIISLEVATVLALAVEPQLPLVVCTSTGGLCADFDIKKNCKSRQSDFKRIYAYRKTAWWLFDLHNIQHGFLMRSLNVPFSCTSLKTRF